jgi:hypothetical protein
VEIRIGDQKSSGRIETVEGEGRLPLASLYENSYVGSKAAITNFSFRLKLKAEQNDRAIHCYPFAVLCSPDPDEEEGGWLQSRFKLFVVVAFLCDSHDFSDCVPQPPAEERCRSFSRKRRDGCNPGSRAPH